jgi:hypothetical protein
MTPPERPGFSGLTGAAPEPFGHALLALSIAVHGRLIYAQARSAPD